MAELICGLYQDYDRLKIMSDNGQQFIENNFMLAEAESYSVRYRRHIFEVVFKSENEFIFRSM